MFRTFIRGILMFAGAVALISPSMRTEVIKDARHYVSVASDKFNEMQDDGSVPEVTDLPDFPQGG